MERNIPDIFEEDYQLFLVVFNFYLLFTFGFFYISDIDQFLELFIPLIFTFTYIIISSSPLKNFWNILPLN